MADQGSLIAGNTPQKGCEINTTTVVKVMRNFGTVIGGNPPTIPTSYDPITNSFEKYIRNIEMTMLGFICPGSGGSCTGYPPEDVVEYGVVYGSNDEYTGISSPKYRRNIVNT
jgi:hypothetical protein